MTKYVRDTAAGQSISAWIITKGKRYVATVQAHYGINKVLVNVWHNDATPMQHGTASGYGYDKFTAALSGLTIDGHVMADHSGDNIKPGKLGYFPSTYKPKKGYRLANYSQYDEKGNKWTSYDLRDAAIKALGPDADNAAIGERVKQLRNELAIIGGYSCCYKESGLVYLEALGYTVIQAI